MTFKNNVNRSRWRSFQHLPPVQTVISIGYFLEMQFLEQDSDKIKHEFFSLAMEVIEKFKETKQVDKSKEEELRRLAKLAHETNMYSQKVEGEFYDMKILEAFLEGAPQTVLQLYVVLSTCNIEDIQWVTLITSFLAYTKTCSEIFLRCPTEVRFFKVYLVNYL